MNDTDVLDELRARMAGVHHDQPLADVVRRGRAVRTRRRAPGLAAAVLAGAGALLVVGTTTGSSTAFARWTSEPQSTDAATAAAIDASCREMLSVRGPGEPPLDLPALAVLDRRGDYAVAVYADARAGYVCDRYEGTGGPASSDHWTYGGAAGRGETHHDRLSAGTPLVINSSSASSAPWEGRDGEVSDVWGWVGPRVTRVVVETRGAQVTAAISNGVFVAWWPSTDAGTSPAVVTAYGADGGVVATATPDLAGFAR